MDPPDRIPLLDLEAQHAPIRSELLAAIARVLDSQVFILGPEVQSLEAEIAAYSGTRFAIGVSSGTDALLAALMALGIGPGDEVITSGYSFFATAGTVARLGATPVFVDIDPVTYNLDPQQVATALSARTRAIMPVHLFGQCAEMAPLLELAATHGVRLIEDAAQAIGAEYRDGRRAGSMGDLACLSFYPSKNLGALGDAGMILTSDPDLADRVRMIRVHGARPKYHHEVIGGNFRLDALQAAVLRVKLGHLDEWTKRRQANARCYVRLFAESGLLDDRRVELPRAVYADSGPPHHHIYNQFVVRVRERDRLSAFLTQAGIGVEVYYPVPFHLQACFQYLGHRAGEFPEAERAAQTTLALPIYPELSEAQQAQVVARIRDFYRGDAATGA